MGEQRFERRLAEELARVRVELGGLESRMRVELEALESRMRVGLGALESRLIDRTARLESRLIRWAVGLWLGQFAVLVAILFAFFRH